MKTIFGSKSSYMTKEKIEQNLILKLTFDFTLALIDYCERLDEKKKYVISMQLLKAGTAIGAYAIEAQNTGNKADFINKFRAGMKEVDGTEYWLLICKHASTYPDCEDLLTRVQEIGAVIRKILFSSKKKNSSNLPADKQAPDKQQAHVVSGQQHSLS